MTVKRITLVLLALAACCAIAACANPGGPARTADPSSALATPVAELPDPAPQTDYEEEKTSMDDLIYITDAARYRGTVASIDKTLTGQVIYRLVAFPGSGMPEQLLVVPTPDTLSSFDFADVQVGDHMEVFYNPPEEAGCGLTCYDILGANLLFPAEMVYYNGILAEKDDDGNGNVDLVMVPEGTPQENWRDPMRQFVFHAGPETQFFTPVEELEEGASLNIYHRGISTRSIPPQGVALEVRLVP